MFKRYHKASQSPIPSWATNQQVLIIFFCAFRNKGEGAPAISDLVQRENNGTGYWIVNMSDSYWGRQQYVIYCSQLRATPSADCNISHIAVGLSSYLILLYPEAARIISTPPERVTSPSQVTPLQFVRFPQQFASTDLYSWVERSTQWQLSVLPRNTTQSPSPGLQPRSIELGTSALAMRPPRKKVKIAH